MTAKRAEVDCTKVLSVTGPHPPHFGSVRFVIDMISHDRPMHEVLQARRKDISAEFLCGFNGMTEHPVTMEDLADAREALIADIATYRPTSTC